eukprot:6882959-Pyramimonas_sp.AAC.1
MWRRVLAPVAATRISTRCQSPTICRTACGWRPSARRPSTWWARARAPGGFLVHRGAASLAGPSEHFYVGGARL